MTRQIVCCGLCTLDHVMRVDHVPGVDEKVVARETLLDFGGPAANAAATVVALGGRARLVTAVGDGDLGRMVSARLAVARVELVDLAAVEDLDPPLSTVLVTRATGERAVVSLNATKTPPLASAPEDTLDGADLLLVDGHHIGAALRLTGQARERGIPVMLDGGSWKPGTDELLPLVDIAVVSAAFHPPGADDVLAYLESSGCPVVAQSRGGAPMRGRVRGVPFELPVPAVDRVVDTLGAGDVLHGAAAWCWRGEASAVEALREAIAVASRSVEFAGARGWVGELPVV